MPSAAPAPTPVRPGPGRASALPRDAGRATELLYVRHGGTVFRYAWHLLGRREDAEDATQATFLAVHSALAGGTAVLEPGAWVLGIARNECMGRLRQERGQPAPDARPTMPAAGGGQRRVAGGGPRRDAHRAADAGGLPGAGARGVRPARVARSRDGRGGARAGREAGYVEYLTARARRSLVLAVGGLEAPSAARRRARRSRPARSIARARCTSCAARSAVACGGR